MDIIATGFHIWGTYHELPHLGQLAYTPMYVSSINMTYLCCTSFYWTSLCSASLSCTFLCFSGLLGLSGVVGAVGVLSGCPLLSGVSGVSVDNLTHLTRAAHGHTVGWCR